MSTPLPNIFARQQQQQQGGAAAASLPSHTPPPQPAYPRPPSQPAGANSARHRSSQSFAQPHFHPPQAAPPHASPYGYSFSPVTSPPLFGHLHYHATHDQEQKEAESPVDAPAVQPSRTLTAGGWHAQRFSQHHAPDLQLLASLRAYLPLLVYHAHPGARDVPLHDAGILALFDVCAAHLAALGRYAPPGPSSAAQGAQQLTAAAVGRATLAKVQELCMAGRTFRSLDALCDALRTYLAAQADAQRSTLQRAGGAAGSEAVLGFTPTGASAKAASPFGFGYAALDSQRSNFLTLHVASPTQGASAAAHTTVDYNQPDQRRIKAAAHATIQDRMAPVNKSADVVSPHANPYLSSAASHLPDGNTASPPLLLPGSDDDAAAPIATLSVTPAELWDDAARALEREVHQLHDFLNSPACTLWAAPAADGSDGQPLLGTSAAQAGIDVSLLDVQRFVAACGGLERSRSLLCMVREASASLGAGGAAPNPPYTSMQELIAHFVRHTHERVAAAVLLYLVYSGEQLLSSPPPASLTLMDVHELMLFSGAGLTTLVHLHTLARQRHIARESGAAPDDKDVGFASIAELSKALHVLETARPHAIDELHRFLSSPPVLRTLFVPSAASRALRPSQQAQLGVRELPEPILPVITLAQAAELMHETRAGNDTLQYVRALCEQMHAASIAVTQPAIGDDTLNGAEQQPAQLRPFASLFELRAAVHELVLKETLFHTLRSCRSLFRHAEAITTDSVAQLLHHVLDSAAAATRAGSSKQRDSPAEQVRALLSSGWALVELVRGLERVRWRRFDDIPELLEAMLGRQQFDDSSSSSDALVPFEQPADNAAGTTPQVVSAPLLMRYVINQLAERQRTFLFLSANDGSAAAPVYSGPRLTVSQIDALYEASGLGIVHRSYAQSRPSCYLSRSFLLPQLRALAAWGCSFATGAALVAALQYRLESQLVLEYLRSEQCTLLRVARSSSGEADSSDGVPPSRPLNLSQGEIDLLLGEMLDRERDLRLLVPLLRKLNTEHAASLAERVQDNKRAQEAPAFCNLQQLLSAVRAAYHEVQHERQSVLQYLMHDTAARALLLQPSSSTSPVGGAVTVGAAGGVGTDDVAELIRRVNSSPHTLRLLRGVVAAGVQCDTMDSLVEALAERSALAAQEQWRILLWLTNCVSLNGAPTKSASGAGKPHGIFRHCRVRNAAGTIPDATQSQSVLSLEAGAFTITAQAAARLYSVAHGRTLQFLRAMDVAQVSVSPRGGLEELEGLVKHMEMKRRVLKFLNSPTCGLFVRRAGAGQRTQAAAHEQAAPSSSIPLSFSGRDVEHLWTEAQSGLATLAYLKLLETRVGQRAQHRMPAASAESATAPGGATFSRGQYTTWAALVADVGDLHRASLLQRKQVLAFLSQSSTELDTPTAAALAEEDFGGEQGRVRAAGTDDALASSSESRWRGVHHLFRAMSFPFSPTPALVDSLFEGQLFDDEDSDDEQQQQIPDGSNAEGVPLASTNPTSLLLLHSAAILPLLMRMDRVQHLSFLSWAALRSRLTQELARTEEEKLAVLLFLSFESSLVAESDAGSSGAERFVRAQLTLSDVDELYERFHFLERGVPVLRLLRILARAQSDGIDEERERLVAAAAATAAARLPSDPLAPTVSERSMSSAAVLERHAFHSLQELGQALELQHQSALFWAQKALFYLRFPAHGNLLCNSAEAVDVYNAAAEQQQLVEEGSAAEENPSVSSLARTLVPLAGKSSDALVNAVHSCPVPVSYASLELLCSAAGLESESPALLLPFLESLDANQYRFDSVEALAQAIRMMMRQWSEAAPPGGPHKYKRAILRFLLDFQRASAGLFELSAVPQAHAEGAAPSETDALLPHTSLAEPVVSVTLESLDALLSEVESVATIPTTNTRQHSSRNPASANSNSSAYPADLVLLGQLRQLAAQAPRFSTFPQLIQAARASAKSWAKTAATLHRFLNDSCQCGLLPLPAAAAAHAREQGREERTTRSVTVDQVVQLMLESGGAEAKDWSSALDIASRTQTKHMSQFALKHSHPISVAERSGNAANAAPAAPASDALERLLELDASGRTFSSVAALIAGLRRAQAALATCKRRVLAFLRDNHEGQQLLSGSDTATLARVSVASVERLFGACRTGFHTLALLRSLSLRRSRYSSWSALHAALVHEHEVRLGPQLKVLRFLLHTDSKGLFNVATISAGAVAAAASSSQDSASHSASFGTPIKLSLQLVSRMYHTVGAGSSTLNYLMALQAQAVQSGGQLSFGSLSALQNALQALVNRDRVLFWLERERETGSLFSRVHAQSKGGWRRSMERRAVSSSFVLTSQLVDEFLALAGTGTSTLMYLTQLARLAAGTSGGARSERTDSSANAADDASSAASADDEQYQFDHLMELAPVLQRMHVESAADRRRVLQYLNDRGQGLLVSRHSALPAPATSSDDVESGGAAAIEAAADIDLEDEAEGTLEEQSGVDAGGAGAEAEQPLQGSDEEALITGGVRRPKYAPVLVSEAQVDTLFEQSGANAFTLQHLQSLARTSTATAPRIFFSILSLARAVRAFEQESLAQRNAVLVYLTFLTPPFFSAPRVNSDVDAGGAPNDAADALSTPSATLASVDQLFLQSAAGSQTLSYLRQLHSGTAFLPALLARTPSPQALNSPPHFENMSGLIPCVSQLHQQALEQRLRVLQFLNDPARCTLLRASSATREVDHTLAAQTTSTSYVPLSAVEALFRSSGAGILTLPLLLALQSARFSFHNVQELAWSLKTAVDSWDASKKRVFAFVLQHGCPPLTGGVHSRLLHLGGQSLDARTARPVEVPLEEVVSVADVDHLFEVGQAGAYTLAHLQNVLLLQEQEALAAGANYSSAQAEMSGYHSWGALVHAISGAHDDYITRVHHVLLAHKHNLFTPTAASKLHLSPAEISQRLLQSPTLQSGALGGSIPFYLRAIVRAQEQLLGVFERVESLEELGALLGEVHARDLQERFAVYAFLAQPANARSLLRVVAGGGDAQVQLSMAAVHRLFDQLGIVAATEESGVLALLRSLQQAGRRFTSFDALGSALQQLHERSLAERRSVHAFLNDHQHQRLFSNMQDNYGRPLNPHWTHAQVGALCAAAGSGPATLALLAQFDTLQLRFNSLEDLAQALRSMSASDERERAQVLAFLHTSDFHLLEASDAGPSASGRGPAVAPSASTSTSLANTLDRLGIDHHPVAALRDLDQADPQGPRPLTTRDVTELCALTKLGPHLLHMLRQLVEQVPTGAAESASNSDSRERVTFTSVAELASAVSQRFEAEVACKRSVIAFLRSEQMRWGAPHLPDDIDAVVDLHAKQHTLRILRRISVRNQPDPGLHPSNASHSSLVGGFDLAPPDDRSLVPCGRRCTAISFTSAASLFEYAQVCRQHEERAMYEVLRLLRDPLRCAVLPETAAARLDGPTLESLLDALDDGSICLCDSMSDLHNAILALERQGVAVQTIPELLDALKQELQMQRNNVLTLRSFLHDGKRCALFLPLSGGQRGASGGRLAVPADLEERLSSPEAAFMGGNTLAYCQLLSHTLAQEHRASGASGVRRTFTTSDSLLSELRAVHAAHSSARRALFQFLNSPAHCSLLRPFAPVPPAQVDALYDAHLLQQASELVNRDASAPAHGGAATFFIELYALLLNMQSLNYSYPNLAALREAVHSVEILTTFGVPRASFMQALQERDSLERAAEAEASKQRLEQTLQASLRAVEQERAAMPTHSDAEFNDVKARLEEEEQRFHIQRERAHAEAARADHVQAAYDRVQKEMAALRAQRQADLVEQTQSQERLQQQLDQQRAQMEAQQAEIQTLHAQRQQQHQHTEELQNPLQTQQQSPQQSEQQPQMQTQPQPQLQQQSEPQPEPQSEQPSQQVAEPPLEQEPPAAAEVPAPIVSAAPAQDSAALAGELQALQTQYQMAQEEIVALRSQVASASAAAASAAAAAAMAASSRSSESAASARPPSAKEQEVLAAVSSFMSEPIDDLSDEETQQFVDYLGNTMLFSELPEDEGLAVDASQLARVAAIAGGVDEALFVLKALDALGHRYSSFAALLPDVSAAVARQRASEASYAAAAAARSATPTPHRSESSVARGPVEVGEAIVEELHLPEESPAPPQQQNNDIPAPQPADVEAAADPSAAAAADGPAPPPQFEQTSGAEQHEHRASEAPSEAAR